MASVDPQHTTISFSGSTSIPCHTSICRAIAFRRLFAPQVMAYCFTPAAIASRAARLISAGAEKSGIPCARLTALCCIACRVISRITDSVKCSTLSERKCLGGAETWAIESKASTGKAHSGADAFLGLVGHGGEKDALRKAAATEGPDPDRGGSTRVVLRCSDNFRGSG